MGYVSTEKIDANLIANLNNAQSHRGPDDNGIWIRNNIALAHRRLSIIDTSENGRQPMANEDKTVWFVFNGEIYNFGDLKKYALKRRHEFASNTDCEVVIHLYEEYGIGLLDLLEGMFAFCLIDLKKNQLFACRDRIGIKPLHYGWSGNDLVISSELQPFYMLPQFNRQVCKEAIVQYLSLGYINAPLTIFSNAKKVMPGHYLTIDLGSEIRDVTHVKYWDICEYAYSGESTVKTVDAAVNAIDSLMSDIITKYLISDVPIGLFLSGGIDSSFVTSYVSRLSTSKPRCLSIGFGHKEYSEINYARTVAKKFGLDHDIRYLSISDIKDLPDPTELFDEPFADSSSYPTFLVSRLAREKVKTILSGDGGDELFAGYERYFRCLSTSKYRRIPSIAWTFFRFFISEADSGYGFLSKLATRFPDNYFDFIANFTGEQLKTILQPSLYDYYVDFRTGLVNKYLKGPKEVPAIRRFQVFDALWYLPGDILAKVDRCSMRVGLEVRVPLLDHRLIELSFKISDSLKYDAVIGKKILLKMLSRYFDDDFLTREKKGFNIPLTEWFRTQNLQRSYMHALPYVSEFCNVEYLKQLVELHNIGKRDFSANMWNVYALGTWMEKTYGQ